MTPSEFAALATNDVAYVAGELGRFSHLLLHGHEYDLLRYHAKVFRDGNEEPFTDLDSALVSGATVFFKDITRKIPAVGDLAAGVKEVTHSRLVQASLVLTRGGARGYDCHSDPYELVVLQLLGTKQWTVYADAKRDAVAWRGELHDGDMLYVPMNWWHFCEPRGLSEHLTISFLR